MQKFKFILIPNLTSYIKQFEARPNPFGLATALVSLNLFPESLE